MENREQRSRSRSTPAQRNRRRRRRNRTILFRVLLVLLVAAIGFGLWMAKKKKTEEEPEVPSVNTETQAPETPEEPEAEPEPEPPAEITGQESEEEKQRKREEALASYVTDYTSAPLLNTTGIQYLSIQVGNTQTELNFTWHSKSSAAGKVVWTNQDTQETKSFTASVAASSTNPGYYVNRATVTGLTPNTNYSYQVGNDAAWSPSYTYKSPAFEDNFTFVVTADAQIGRYEESRDKDIEMWDKAVTRIKKNIPESSFLIHAGDQVETGYSLEDYAGFEDHLALYSMALAPVVGNHDVMPEETVNPGPFFYEHFTVPNRSTVGVRYGDTDGDYWFRYGDVLFLVLNTSALGDNDIHMEGGFVQDAIAKNQDAKWRIVVGHYPAFSSAEKYQGVSNSLRGDWIYMAQNYDIDLFLSGHDHSYTRSILVDEDGEPLYDYDYSSGATLKNPEGALYVTIGTASGCMYTPSDHDNYAAAVQGQPEQPMALRVDVTENKLTMTAYLLDTWEVYDSYTIQKD